MTSKLKVGNSSALYALGARYKFGTMRERKNGFLVPKRHWMKHLAFLSFLTESRRSVVQNHSPDNLFSSPVPPRSTKEFPQLVPKARFLPTWIDCRPSPKGSLQMKLRRRLYSRLC